MTRPGLALAALGASVALWPSAAEAYCRTASCDGRVGALCVPAGAADCGIPLYWATRCVGFTLHEGASRQVPLATAETIAQQAFDAWAGVDCGGGARPSIEARYLGAVACDQARYDAEASNANVIVFRDDGWPYTGSTALALTTVTYSLETGEIRDADIELDATDAVLTTGDDDVDVDVASILTHEVGHFLGLAHSPAEGATMERDYTPRSITLRTLEADDAAGICAVYPPDRSALCDEEPVGGLADACPDGASAEEEGGCAVAPPGGGAGSAAAAALAAAVVALGGRLRRRSARER